MTLNSKMHADKSAGMPDLHYLMSLEVVVMPEIFTCVMISYKLFGQILRKTGPIIIPHISTIFFASVVAYNSLWIQIFTKLLWTTRRRRKAGTVISVLEEAHILLLSMQERYF